MLDDDLEFAQSAALEYAKSNIRVNICAPATTDTPMVARFAQQWPEWQQKTNASYPPGRIAAPEVCRSTLKVFMTSLFMGKESELAWLEIRAVGGCSSLQKISNYEYLSAGNSKRHRVPVTRRPMRFSERPCTCNRWRRTMLLNIYSRGFINSALKHTMSEYSLSSFWAKSQACNRTTNQQ
jgi:hypothetical protein